MAGHLENILNDGFMLKSDSRKYKNSVLWNIFITEYNSEHYT